MQFGKASKVITFREVDRVGRETLAELVRSGLFQFCADSATCFLPA